MLMKLTLISLVLNLIKKLENIRNTLLFMIDSLYEGY